MNKQRLIVVGNGMAAVQCIQEIVECNPSHFEIFVFGSEPYPGYNRILLSSVLQGSKSFDDISLNYLEWYEEHGIQLFTGETVVKIDTERKRIVTNKEKQFPYDKLIIATGSVPNRIPIPGNDKEGVLAFRTIEDCRKMIEISQRYKHAAVIGGGLLGLEAARGLMNLGMTVNVIHKSEYLMERQLDKRASKMLQNELENQGMNFLLNKETSEIIGENHVEGLRFKDGSDIEADLIVMAAGVRPNVQLAAESGIHVNRAILVNDYLETSQKDVYAVGECTEHKGVVYGLVKPLYEQGKVLAKHVCGLPVKGYPGSVLSTHLKVSGIDVFSAGLLDESETAKERAYYDEIDGVYKKMIFQDNKLVGAVLFGDTKDGMKYLDLIVKKKDLSDEEKSMLFQSSDGSAVDTLENSDIICNCNAVSKGMIIEAVLKEGLETIEEVKACTKASGSCGGCRPLVGELLSYIKSDNFNEEIEHNPMCACTSLTEEEVVFEMQMRGVTTVQEVMNELGWENNEGCSLCRPALNYYLGMIHPDLSKGTYTNAILQENGTYSITPQLYGGLTSAEELRKIADVAQKYNISNIEITSEQRINLVGIKKEDLQSICSELDVAISSANGHIIQTVKTSAGETSCKCEKLHAQNLAIKLEKCLNSLTTPNRLKIAVSSCPLDCASAMIEDIGIIYIDRGWEIYAGGSKTELKKGKLLSVASTEDEAIDLIRGTIQYYRETANYLESVWQWLDRAGLIHIREVLFSKELLHQLLSRQDEDIARLRKTERSYS
ncbi:nitrite reductase large subunit NirB [Bacillus gobiensis]|uniref:nitrite reductase large subunit NirB n=1 Tax=Bacillus gobiensis TaxID=1441095 RepID=UPI003D260783